MASKGARQSVRCQTSLQAGIHFGFGLEGHVEPPVVVVQPGDAVHRNRADRTSTGIREREGIGWEQLSRNPSQAVRLTRQLVRADARSRGILDSLYRLRR